MMYAEKKDWAWRVGSTKAGLTKQQKRSVRGSCSTHTDLPDEMAGAGQREDDTS